jgi:hypothetical protein
MVDYVATFDHKNFISRLVFRVASSLHSIHDIIALRTTES